MNNYIPLNECKHKELYRLDSRNLSIGVFNSLVNGFIGIRTKFSNRFLSCEYHYDTGAPFGTARPLESLNMVLPDDIEPLELLPGSIDHNTKRLVACDENRIKNKEWPWYFVDTGEFDSKIKPYAISNNKLFEWLDK